MQKVTRTPLVIYKVQKWLENNWGEVWFPWDGQDYQITYDTDIMGLHYAFVEFTLNEDAIWMEHGDDFICKPTGFRIYQDPSLF